MNWQNSVERETEKRLRTVLAAFVLLMAVSLAVLVTLYPKRYIPRPAPLGGKGFVALCYEGVGHLDGQVTPERLREQLAALRDAGYVSVGSSQVTAYRETGAPLPEKAVYLVFKDEGAQTALLAGREIRKADFCAAFPAAATTEQWDCARLTHAQVKAYLQSGYWQRMLSGFSDGTGWNEREGPLTWLRPGEGWSSGQLLMRLAQARGESFRPQSIPAWDNLSGGLSSDGTLLTLTPPVDQDGVARLMVGKYRDWRVQVQFLGNEAQSVYLRAGARFDAFVRLRWREGILTGTQLLDGAEETLFACQVGREPLEITLNGSELLVRQKEETVAWVRTTVREAGYLCLDALSPEDGGNAADGVFRISVARHEGVRERKVYDSVQPVRAAWHGMRRAWRTMWDWLRIQL